MPTAYRRLRLAAPAFLATAFVSPGVGATDVPGGNIINQTWNEAGSPYVVQGDIIIPNGAYLHIEEGTVVHFPGGDMQGAGLDTGRVEVINRGELVVAGTDAKPVSFQSQNGGTTTGVWYGVVVEDMATTTTFEHARIANVLTGILHEDTGASSLTDVEVTAFQSYGIRANAGQLTLDNLWIHDGTNYALYIVAGTHALTNYLAHDALYGIYAFNMSQTTATNVTIDDTNVGARIDGASPSLTLRNAIVTNCNTGLYRSGGTLSVSYSNVWNNNTNFTGSVTQGAGMISSNPQYENAAGDDFHLAGSSVCIDAGTTTGAPDHDLDGVSRPIDGDGINADEYDMGAYEYVSTANCGNGAQEAGEACDDGGNNGMYGFCKGDCSGDGPFCGDGNVDAGDEECDDGNQDNNDACLNDCTLPGGGTTGGTGGGSTGGTGAGTTSGGTTGATGSSSSTGSSGGAGTTTTSGGTAGTSSGTGGTGGSASGTGGSATTGGGTDSGSGGSASATSSGSASASGTGGPSTGTGTGTASGGADTDTDSSGGSDSEGSGSGGGGGCRVPGPAPASGFLLLGLAALGRRRRR